jgi:DNA repair protein RadD
MLTYWYQKEAVNAMLECKDNGVVVLPTGSGKSHVLKDYSAATDENILVLSHVKEILVQNFQRLAPLGDVGLISSGLGLNTRGRVTVAGIQSVWRYPETFRDIDRILIDEAHLVRDEGMYNSFLSDLGKPFMGLTATDFRLKGGYIHGPDGMFDSICYQAPVDRLTREGYLCPLVYQSSKEPLDTTGIRLSGGDFNLKDMSLAFNRDAVTDGIVEQVAPYGENFKHILIFCIDIEHAEVMAAKLTAAGVPTEAVHSKSPRDATLERFKAGKVQAITNVNVLTTGFDFPAIDLLVLVRPTKSMGLHQQMLGRGMRTHPSKAETLVKDFTRNTLNLGSVENPAPLAIKGKRGKG